MDSNKIILYSSCLMIKIADSDDKITKDENLTIKEILIDFFNISNQKASEFIELANKHLKSSVDLYKYSKYLNIELSYQDKLDLIKCIFEVGYSDGKLDYLEYHYIKTISTLLSIDREDMIKSKREIKKFF